MPDSNDKALSWKAVLVLLVMVLILNAAMLMIIHTRYQDSYYAALADKMALLENTTSPRLIFVGGSNVAFGIDSQTIQEESGYQVVNMGLNGNLGMRFMLAVVSPFLRTDDVVVIMPEYQQFLNPKDNVGPTLVQTLIANPQFLKYVNSFPGAVSIAELFPYVYTQAIKTIWRDLATRDCMFCKNDEQIYYRAAFNAFGDVISHEKIHPTREIAHISLRYDENNPNISHTIDTINSFVKRAKAQGAHPLLIYPATPSPANETTTTMLNYLAKRLQNELSFPVIGNPQAAWYSRALFFDTYYHLTPEGRTLNTERILEQITSYIYAIP